MAWTKTRRSGATAGAWVAIALAAAAGGLVGAAQAVLGPTSPTETLARIAPFDGALSVLSVELPEGVSAADG